MAVDRSPNDKADTRAIAAEPTTIMAVSPPASYLGVLLKERYLIERELGRGGIGAIYLARDRQLLDKAVVIKIMLGELEVSQYLEYFKLKFRQEIKALARIDHPGIVGVLDAGETPDGKPYFVMQYVEGQSLRAAIGQKGMELVHAAEIIRQIGHALSAAHNKGIYHRDLKPENIMLQDLGRGEELVKLIDFGMATVKDSQSAAHTEVTKVAGTLPYMAPEQLRGKPSALSDIYSFGVIAYEMVTGYLPYKSDSPVQQYEMQRAGELHLPCDLRPGLAVTAQAAILKALAFDAQERFQNAREFGDELALALTASLEKARRPTAKLAAATDRLAPPVAGADLRSAERQANVHKFDTPAHAAKPTQLLDEARPTIFSRESKVRMALLIAAMVLLVLVLIFWSRRSTTPQDTQTPSPAVAPVVPAAAPLSLNYSLVVQRYRNGKPHKEPYQLAGHEAYNLEEGDQVRFQLSSPQAGYLYLINEGPQLINGLPDYNLLFPAAPVNGGTALVKENQLLQVPGPASEGLHLDTQIGTEKIWLLWSAGRLAEVESVRARLGDTIAIKNPADSRTLQQLLTTHTATKPEIVGDETSKQSQLKGRGPVLVTLLTFEHH